MSSRACPTSGRVENQLPENDVGKPPFEAAQRFSVTLFRQRAFSGSRPAPGYHGSG